MEWNIIDLSPEIANTKVAFGMKFEIRKLERKLKNTLDSSNRIQRLLEKRERDRERDENRR